MAFGTELIHTGYPLATFLLNLDFAFAGVGIPVKDFIHSSPASLANVVAHIVGAPAYAGA